MKESTNINSKKLVLVLALACLATSGFSVNASAALHGLVKTSQQSGTGKCMPSMRGSVSGILSANKARAYSGKTRKAVLPIKNLKKLSTSDSRTKALAHVLNVVDRIGHGRFSAHKGVTAVFGTNHGQSSRKIGDQIHLNPGNQNVQGGGSHNVGGTDNKALIAHELGHYVGIQLYQKYEREVRRCHITGYARRSLGEEFAEVFAAYITDPGLFKGKGRACDGAFAWMKAQFGEKRLTQSCSSRKSS